MKTYNLLYSKPFRNFLISNGIEGKRIYAKMKLYGMKKVERDDSLFEAIPEIEDWYIRFITEYIIPSLRSTCFKELSNDSNNTQFMFTKDLSARKIKNNSVFLDLEAFIASKTTAAGSDPSSCLTISTLALSLHTISWSIAAALNVSAAATMTFLP